jgi:hypothetical protein
LKKAGVSVSVLNLNSGARPDAGQLEKMIAEFSLAVFIITQDAIKQPGFVFAVEAATLNQVGVLLVHDAVSCFLPSGQGKDLESVLLINCRTS